MAKKASTPRVSVSYAKCLYITSEGGTCPLCGAEVKPMERHECRRAVGAPEAATMLTTALDAAFGPAKEGK